MRMVIQRRAFKFSLGFLGLAVPLCVVSAEPPEHPSLWSKKFNLSRHDPTSEIDELVEYQVPEGWDVWRGGPWPDEKTKDPLISLVKEFSFIRIHLFGGKESRYPTPEEYMASFAPPSFEGPTVELGTETVAGMEIPMYRRRITMAGDPYGRVPESSFPTVQEYFCVVPLGERFVVLSYSYEPPQSHHESVRSPFDVEGEETWEAFLKTFQVRRK